MFGEQDQSQPTFEITIDQDSEENQHLLQTPETHRHRSARKSVTKTPVASIEDVISVDEEQEGEPMQQLFKTPATQKRPSRKSVAKTPVASVEETVSEDEEQEGEPMQQLFKTPATDRKSTRLNYSHRSLSSMPSSA